MPVGAGRCRSVQCAMSGSGGRCRSVPVGAGRCRSVPVSPVCARCAPGVQCQGADGVFGPGAARPPVGPYIAAHAIFFRNLHCNLIGRLHPRSPLYLQPPTGGPLYTNKRNPLHCPAQNFFRPRHAPHPLRPARPPAPASLGRQRVQQGIAPDGALVVLGEALPRPRIDLWSYAPAPERTGHGPLFLAPLVLRRPSTGIAAVHPAAVPADERRSALFACLPVL